MNIFQTNIIDSNYVTECNESKIQFANFLIESVAPLFYEEIRKKQKQYSMKKVELISLNEVVSNKKESLVKINGDIERENFKKEIFNLIDTINPVKITDKQKSSIKLILNSIDSKSIEVLKKWISFLQKINKQQKTKEVNVL